MRARALAFWIHRSSGTLAAAAVALGASILPTAFRGREPLEALFDTIPWLAPALALCLTVALSAHIATGIVLWVAAADPPRQGDGLVTLQRLSGWLAAAFLLFHLGHAWLWGHALPIEAYAALRSDLGTLPYLLVYCAGITALALHLGQAASFLSRARQTIQARRSTDTSPTHNAESSRAIHLAAWVGSSILWLFLIAGLSFFATGTASFWSF